jgi:two-component system, OmpR family, sensor histidine kinase MtrB
MGLRARVTVAFGVSGLVLSLTLAGITFFKSRTYLLHQREATAVRQAMLNAQAVQDSLTSGGEPLQTLSRLDRLPNSQSLVFFHGLQVASPDVIDQDVLTASMRANVSNGHPAWQLLKAGGVPRIVVGVRLPVGAEYYELFSLFELKRTMGALQAALAAGALVTMVGGAALGWSVSSKLLAPLTDVAEATAAVAAGDLDTRIGAMADKDLDLLASSFNRMADALQKRIERDAHFASDVSHELRSPLTTLAASLQVLERRRDEMPEPAQRALDLMGSEVVRFEHLVQDLLEISRFDAGAAELTSEEVQLGEFVRQAVGTAAPVEVAPDVEAMIVSLDKRRVERVIANLLENARLHAGGAARVRVHRVEDGFEVGVEDNGPGVPSAERARIFDRFVRGASAGGSDAGEGVGLGLALVAEHVTLHGGEVRVEDADGGGSRFVVRMPA